MIDDKELCQKAVESAKFENDDSDSYLDGYYNGYRACEKRQEGGKIEEIKTNLAPDPIRDNMALVDWIRKNPI